jgi:hypothetical protein
MKEGPKAAGRLVYDDSFHEKDIFGAKEHIRSGKQKQHQITLAYNTRLT